MGNTLEKEIVSGRYLSTVKGFWVLFSRISLYGFLFLSVALISGCASTEVELHEEIQTPQKPLIWPSPPEPARVSYFKTISKPADIGANKGFFRKVAEFLLGPKYDDIIKPYGISTDSGGRILVADTAFKRIHIYDVKNNKYSYIEEAGDAALDSPIALAVDGEDNIYVTDSVANNVCVFNSKGRFLFSFNGGKRPTGIAINKADKLVYVSDTGKHEINVYDLKGKRVNTIGKWGSQPGEFNYPVDIFIDGHGDLFVADSMNFRIQIFDKGGKFLSTFGHHGDGTGDFGRPKGISVDKEGNIYVADALFDTVQIFDRNGNFLLNFGRLGKEIGSFWLPSGVFIDSGDKIYISDSYNRRIQVFEYHGNS
ncbi:MAG: 6-bladed beta-propeller [Deltaproteobacteria bacterium]|nr:6-bladed beta-propeller [Deltaproteobacteria bacterium]